MGAIIVRWSWWWGERGFFMAITPEKIKVLLEAELSTLRDTRVLSHIRRRDEEPDFDYDCGHDIAYGQACL